MVSVDRIQFRQTALGLIFAPFPFLKGRLVPKPLENRALWEGRFWLAAAFTLAMTWHRIARGAGYAPNWLLDVTMCLAFASAYVAWVAIRSAGWLRVPRSSLPPRQPRIPAPLAWCAVAVMAVFAAASAYEWLVHLDHPDARSGSLLFSTIFFSGATVIGARSTLRR